MDRKRVLILGGSSLLGRYLLKHGERCSATWFSNKPHDVSVDWHHLNIQRYHDITHLFHKLKPQIVIHCAAIGSVDYCENNYNHAYSVNVDGVRNVMEAAKDIGAKVVMLSTNAVFNGENPPYAEDAPRHPVNRYGSMKMMAEDIVMGFPKKMWMIVRPILLYGWPWLGGRENWATTVIDKLRRGESLKIVNDTVTQPTHAGECARIIWELIRRECAGVYHVGGLGNTDLYNFARHVAREFTLPECLLEAVQSSHFQNIAPRPKNTTYDVRKVNEMMFPHIPCGYMKGIEMMRFEEEGI